MAASVKGNSKPKPKNSQRKMINNIAQFLTVAQLDRAADY